MGVEFAGNKQKQGKRRHLRVDHPLLLMRPHFDARVRPLAADEAAAETRRAVLSQSSRPTGQRSVGAAARRRLGAGLHLLLPHGTLAVEAVRRRARLQVSGAAHAGLQHARLHLLCLQHRHLPQARPRAPRQGWSSEPEI